ncbi:hypothetical protein SmJEL517_g01377 [Synchytrium microbalum]|uniref:Aminopeptidase n=1 Tax=Synchytrium microbalum TaxID=1806994 RepID=A0A507CAA5_9FUNG|nr:uncharacterized protein SmJEL517_g01377 [Synchytrium microbalum]TPX36532.1 hypothetical protein SmJEL517_g01377 [Synchytrium microbalum]
MTDRRTSNARDVLPTSSTPSHYDVTLTVNGLETDFKFKGIVKVTLKINEDTTKISCNSNDIEIHHCQITSTLIKTDSTQVAKSITLDKPTETATFEFASVIKAGSTAVLHIEFTGNHNDQLAGFYRSKYTDPQGNTKYMAVTQFEATDARRCFPCWDEPALKATFDSTLIIPTGLTGLSNMDVLEDSIVQVDGKDFTRLKFERTPIMSTYLVAYVVSALDVVEDYAHPKSPADAKPIKVRVFTPQGLAEQGRFALFVATRTLEFFSEYFDIAYPLSKSDLVAIPDFGGKFSGAMENWGLVTYRTVLLLFDEENTSAATKQRIAYVIGHELAHQWFGNLVTMDWWSDLWLNEGFATFVGWLSTDHLFPDWDVWTQFVMDDEQRAFQLDGLRSSHPIEVDVKNPAEISQIFDAISYSKGASVIRMLNGALGGDNFMKGVRSYLKKFSYSNAATSDLWASLSEASGVDVNALMYPWTREMGYPILTIDSEKYDAVKNEMHITLTQSRYLSSGDVKPEEDKVIWTVPLVISTNATGKNPHRIMMTGKTQSIVIPYTESDHAFWKLNYESTGFFRVKLPQDTLLKLCKEIYRTGGDVFSSSDRIGVLTDAWALARAGYGSTVGALEVLRWYAKEESYIVLTEMNAQLSSLQSIWHTEPQHVQQGLLTLKKQIFGSKARAIGYEYPKGEDHLTTLKRNLVIAVAAKAGDEEVVGELLKRFGEYRNGNEAALSANLRGAAFVTFARHSSTKAEFDVLANLYKTIATPDQKLSVLQSLGGINSLDIIKSLLDDFILNTELVRSQDLMYPISGISNHNRATAEVRAMLWDWLKRNWDQVIFPRYEPSLTLLGRVCQLCVEDRVGLDFADEVDSWADGRELGPQGKGKRQDQIKSIRRMLDQSLEKVRSNTKWLERERENVSKWIASGLSESKM